MFHAHMIKTRFDRDVYVDNAFVTMYTKCGSIEDEAGKSFLGCHCMEVIAWWTLHRRKNCLANIAWCLQNLSELGAGKSCSRVY
jgi:hypothetical protein